MRDVLNACDRSQAGPTAPPHGLFLVRAREHGIYVPDFGYDRGIQALRRAVQARADSYNFV